MAERTFHKLNINISDATLKQLQDNAREENTTVTNVVRRAVSVYSFLQSQLDDENRSLQIVDNETGKVTTLALV